MWLAAGILTYLFILVLFLLFLMGATEAEDEFAKGSASEAGTEPSLRDRLDMV